MKTRADIEDQSYSNYKKRIDLFHVKNQDYASEDALSNFKRIALVCEIWHVDVTKSDGVADFNILEKLDRYFNLKWQGKTPKNESLADTFVIDLPNYIDLSWALQTEENPLSELEQIDP